MKQYWILTLHLSQVLSKEVNRFLWPIKIAIYKRAVKVKEVSFKVDRDWKCSIEL